MTNKTYQLTARIDKTYSQLSHIYNGKRKIATISHFEQFSKDWEVVLYPAKLGFRKATEQDAKEFVRKEEETYLGMLGCAVSVIWADSVSSDNVGK